MNTTPQQQAEAIAQMNKAVKSLFLVLPKLIALDVQQKWENAKEALQTEAAPSLQWVKADKELPEEGKDVCIKMDGKPGGGRYVFDGFTRNFCYQLANGDFGFLSSESFGDVEWLSEASTDTFLQWGVEDIRGFQKWLKEKGYRYQKQVTTMNDKKELVECKIGLWYEWGGQSVGGKSLLQLLAEYSSETSTAPEGGQ